MPDVGLTHVALTVTDSEKSAAFYGKYADMSIVHRRPGSAGHGDVLWLSDGTRPFVIVLLPQERVLSRLAGPLTHLGVGVADRNTVDELLSMARAEGLSVYGPIDAGPPVGYWGTIDDPDGHALELAHGQEVGLIASSGDNRNA